MCSFKLHATLAHATPPQISLEIRDESTTQYSVMRSPPAPWNQVGQ